MAEQDWEKAAEAALKRIEGDFDKTLLSTEELEVFDRCVSVVADNLVKASKLCVEANGKPFVRRAFDVAEAGRLFASAIHDVKTLYDAFPHARRSRP